MKKIIALCLLMCLFLAGCGGSGSSQSNVERTIDELRQIVEQKQFDKLDTVVPEEYWAWLEGRGQTRDDVERYIEGYVDADTDEVKPIKVTYEYNVSQGNESALTNTKKVMSEKFGIDAEKVTALEVVQVIKRMEFENPENNTSDSEVLAAVQIGGNWYLVEEPTNRYDMTGLYFSLMESRFYDLYFN